MEEMIMFGKEERSTFKYWFAHWCAFQMTALNNKCWKFKYLFHDILKPWIKLVVRDYKKVQSIHRSYSKHHLEYYLKHGKADFNSMMLDWECSRFTKSSSPLTAIQELEKVSKKFVKEKTISGKVYKNFLYNCSSALVETNLVTSENLDKFTNLFNKLLELGDKKL